MNVTKEYYNLMDFSASQLMKFFEARIDDSEFENTARRLYPHLVKDREPFLMVFDLVRCYRGLGHDCSLQSKETLGLFMIVFHSILNNSETGFSLLNPCIDTAGDSFKTVIESVSSQIRSIPDDYDFLVANVLDELGEKDLKKRYYVLLYRFCSVVAKADNKFSSKESEWLGALLRVSEGKVASMAESISLRPAIIPQVTRIQSLSDSKSNGVRSSNPVYDQIKSSKALAELESLIGLGQVKKEIGTLANFAMVQVMRKNEGMKTVPLSLHCVFSGNPGTGKTTVARLVARIYKDLGLLQKGHLVETDRSGLVAEYLGQTAGKTNEVIDSAMGGVLFIDEAYSLVNDSKEDYGKEAIATLLKRMEDQRDKFVVILAGYTDNMDKFLESNPGLRSRFSRMICFEDYSPEELFEIYLSQLRKFDYTITPQAREVVLQKCRAAASKKDKTFGNGRFARNLFEKTLENQANRVAYLPAVDQATLGRIERDDVESL